MSQVIVTEDTLRAKREASALQEHKIDREGQYARWRRNDITGKDHFEALVGYAVVPILALWGLLIGAGAVMLQVLNVIFKALGKLFGGKTRIK